MFRNKLSHTISLSPFFCVKRFKAIYLGANLAALYQVFLFKAEAEVPGIAFQIVSSILESQSPKLNVIEHLLKLTGSSAGPDSYLESQGGYYAELEQHAHEVKKILSSLPEIVLDRSRFLDNIK